MGNKKFRNFQVGFQSNPAVPAALTRRLRGTLTPKDTRQREALTDENTGTISAQREWIDLAYGSEWGYSAPFTFEEFAIFLRGIDSTIAPNVLVASQAFGWGYDPGVAAFNDPTFLTLCAGDDSGAVRAIGCYVTKIVVKGGEKKALTLDVTLSGRRLTAGTLASLTVPTTEIAKSALDLWTLDDSYASLGVTARNAHIFSWTLTLETGITQDWSENGSLDMTGISHDSPKMTLDYTGKWNALGVAEFDKFDSRALRYLTMTSGGSLLSGAFSRRFRYRLAGMYSKFEVLTGDVEGICTLDATLESTEDSANAYMFNLGVQNAIATLT